MPPPPGLVLPLARLKESVLLVTVIVPVLLLKRPPPLLAELLLIVVFVTVTVPVLLWKMPAPSPAGVEFPLRTQSVTFTVAALSLRMAPIPLLIVMPEKLTD